MTNGVQHGGIVGHDEVMGQLWRALEQGHLHHALLFEGPRGVGKRAVARQLAKAANCEREDGPRPCDVCPTCRQITEGSHPDVVFVEPSADRATPVISVAQVREVVRKTGYHRYNARRRFFVFDPAESMPPASANALLKTLEEPPDGTGFILIATHASSLLSTIASRCQRVRFSAVPHDVLVRWLEARRVPAASQVARLAGGCPGRALELADGKLEAQRTIRDSLIAATELPLGGRFEWSKKATRGGRRDWRKDVELIFEQVEGLLRDASVLGSGADVGLLNDDRPDVVDRWARALWPAGVVRCAEAVERAREGLRLNVAGRLVLDTLLAELCEELG